MYIMNAFDIETFIDKDQKYIPYCVCFNISSKMYSHYYKKDFDIVVEAIDKIFDLITDKIDFYIHNLDFDGIILVSYLSNYPKYKYECFTRDMSFYKLKISYLNKSINFICSYKIFPLSLEKIATSFTSLSKMPFPYLFSTIDNLDYIGPIPDSKYWKNFKHYDQYFKTHGNFFDFKTYSTEYCINDVKITYLFIEKISEIIKDFNIKIEEVNSGPSLAFKIFFKKFNKNRISYITSGFYDRIVRQAYYGGRCEVYGNPKEGDYIYHYDFSGMYAQCMQEKICFGEYKVKTNDFDLNKPGFYWIEFESDMEIPVLPMHHYENNKLIFPNGKNLKGCYWFEEIELFLKRGGKIKKILYGIEYKKYDYVFNEYVDFFTNIRKKGEAYSSFGKNMNNFLYGRFGLTEPNEHTFFIQENELDYYLKWKKYEIKKILKINTTYMLSINLTTQVKKDFNLSKNKFKKNVGISAAISSKGRIKLYKAQEDVKKNGGEVKYSDTDSIFATYKRDVINEKHGAVYWDIKNKKTCIKDAIFINPKTYGLLYYDNTEEIKIKGFNTTELNFSTLKENFYLQKNIIQKVNIIKRKNFNLAYEKIDKILNTAQYDKRIFINNFKDTKPIVYNPHY